MFFEDRSGDYLNELLLGEVQQGGKLSCKEEVKLVVFLNGSDLYFLYALRNIKELSKEMGGNEEIHFQLNAAKVLGMEPQKGGGHSIWKNNSQE
jgi:hypothetical protein